MAKRYFIHNSSNYTRYYGVFYVTLGFSLQPLGIKTVSLFFYDTECDGIIIFFRSKSKEDKIIKTKFMSISIFMILLLILKDVDISFSLTKNENI